MFIEKNRGLLTMVATCSILAMICIDFTAVNLALAQIANEFNADMSAVQWIIDGFVIAGAVLLIVAGRLSDIFGKKRFFILGAAIFTLSSALAGFSNNIWLLVFSRTIQGVGLAIVFPVTMVLAASAFPANKKGMAIGITGAVSGLAQAIGPTFAGFVMQFSNWHWIFFLNLPIGVLSIALAALVCKPDEIKAVKSKVNWLEVLIFVIGLFLIIYALNESNSLGINSKAFWSLIILGLIILTFFMKLELKAETPLIDFRLFSNRNFLSLNLVRGLFGYIFFSFIFIICLYLQNIRGYDSLHAGLMLLFVTVVYALLSPFSGKWIDSIGVKIPLIFGVLSASAGLLLLANISGATTWQYLILPLTLMGISIGIILSCATVAALKAVPSDKAGIASGILYTNASIGNAIGIGTTGLLISSISAHHLKNLLMNNNIIIEELKFDFLNRIVNGTGQINSLFTNFDQALAGQLFPLVQDSFIHGLTIVMIVCFSLTLIALLLTLFCKN